MGKRFAKPMEIIDLTGDDDGNDDDKPDEDKLRRLADNKEVRATRCRNCLKYVKNLPTMITECGHIFCRECLLEALQNNQRCPLCHMFLTEKSYIPIYSMYKK